MLKRSFRPNVRTPKQVMTPYIMYIKKQFANKKKTITDTGLHGVEQGQHIMKLLAKDWSELSQKQKNLYKKHAEADQIRYDREMKQLLSQGFFIREDGTKTQNNRKVGTKRQMEHVPAETANKRLKK
jgi:hypothetical protein